MAIITTLTKEQEERLKTEHMAEVSGIGITPQREIDNAELMDMIAQINNSAPVHQEETSDAEEEQKMDSDDNKYIMPEDTSKAPDPIEEIDRESEDESTEEDDEYLDDVEPEYNDPHYEDYEEDYELEEPEYNDTPDNHDELHTDATEAESLAPDPILQPAEKLKTVTTDAQEPFVIHKLPQNKAVKILIYFGIYNAAAWIIALLVYFF